jgi:hypothetical protein
MRSVYRKVLLVGVGLVGGCAGTGAPTVPTLLSPHQGQPTGTVWRTGAAPNPLRPEFRWTAVEGAVGYAIQIDGSCSARTDCAFTAPIVDEKTFTTSFTPAADLPVATTPPVGTRYYWRVSPCNASGVCADWSRVGIVDVGRQRQDMNGDGYADLAVVARSKLGSALFVYLGGPVLPMSPSWVVRPDVSPDGATDVAFGQVLWVGDVNADGFADLAVVVYHQGGPQGVRLYVGGPSPATTPTQELSTSISSDATVVSLLAGDMNGDGFADLFQSYLGDSSFSDVVSFGPDLGTDQSRTQSTASRVVASCDVDSDGYTDLVRSDSQQFRGSPGGPFGALEATRTWPPAPAGSTPIACAWNVSGLGTPSLVISPAVGESLPSLVVSTSPATPASMGCDAPLPSLPAGSGGGGGGNIPGGGSAVTDMGDVDGDGYDDLLVGDPMNNRAAIFFGGCPIQRVVELPGGTEFAGTPDAGGAVAATGDLDGDGYPDFAVANVFGGLDDYCTGEVYIYGGGPSSGARSTPSVILTDPDHAATPGGCAEDGFGTSLD